jgi:hypothetical protein
MFVKTHARQFNRIFESGAEFIGQNDFRIVSNDEVATIQFRRGGRPIAWRGLDEKHPDNSEKAQERPGRSLKNELPFQGAPMRHG